MSETTPDQLFLQPAPGLMVVDPATGKPLPADGKQVDSSIYWLRRLNEGDVTEVQTPIESAAATETTVKTARNK